MDHFINVLKDDISIVKELPDEFSWSTREYYATAIRATRIKTAPVHASANWYLENALPMLQRLVVPKPFVRFRAKLLFKFFGSKYFCLHFLVQMLKRIMYMTN